MKQKARRLVTRWISLILSLAMATSLAVTGAWATDQEVSLSNGDFSSGTAENWTLTGFSEVTSDSYAANNTTPALNLWLSDTASTEASAAYTVSLEAGSYYFSFDLSGKENASSGLRYAVTSGSSTLADGDEVYTTLGWDVWSTYQTQTFTLAEPQAVTFCLSGTVPSGYWGYLDQLQLFQADDETSTETPDPEGYRLSVSVSNPEPQVGEEVTLTAKVTLDGKEITDLVSANLNLYWYVDIWNDHTDGSDDCTLDNSGESGKALSATVTFNSAAKYYIVAKLQDSSWADLTEPVTTTFLPTDSAALEGYQVTISANTEETLHVGDTASLTAKVTLDGKEITDLAGAGLHLWWWTDTWAEGHAAGLTDAEYSNNDGNSGSSFTTDVTLPSEGTYYIAAELQDSSNTRLGIAYIPLQAEKNAYVTGDLDVEKIAGLDSDFIMGLDISSVVSEFDSGVSHS